MKSLIQCVITLLACLPLIVCSRPSSTHSSVPETTDQEVLVIGIVDGDTVDVDIDGQTHRIRYIGVDTPERGQPGYFEATEANAALVSGKKVTLERDVSDSDRYGRLLRYVYLGDAMVNATLVEKGYAVPMNIPPDVKHADMFRELAIEKTDTDTSPPFVDRDCKDFTMHSEAQRFFIAHGGPDKDPHRLDGNHNGVACEALLDSKFDGCTLTGGEMVVDGWAGKDTGTNFCNQCRCSGGKLACTKMYCQIAK